MYLIVLSLALFMGISFFATAGTDPILTRPILGGSGQFIVNAESYNKDFKYFSLSVANRNAIANNSILNTVGVGIDEQSSTFIKSSFTAKVTLQIITYDKNEVATGTFTRLFTVNYDTTTGAKYNSLDYTTYNNAFALRVKILSIDSGSVNWPISRVLKVENQLTATRDYPFSCTLALQDLSTSLNSTSKELIASWTSPSLDANSGVSEYDLEWAWVDEGALNNYKSGVNYLQDLIFSNNATRVSITSTSYQIPLLYDDLGKIFVRVRPIQIKVNGQRVEGKWNWIANDANQPVIATNPVMYSFEGHENWLNWQASTSFAEEGNRKSVVQYFDGSLRARQTVTKDNTNGTAVVGESFYDYQGSVTIQVLPVPSLSNTIEYVRNFNKAIGYNEYPKSVYDKLGATTNVCGNPSTPFNTDFGSAKYYSAKNGSVNVGTNKFIPNSTGSNPNEGYPFTETRFYPDGTIAAQGGVGVSHQIGTGHETKYYYETPAQEELDALFGTDAGIASHYTKNIVRDANGQFNVSYIDMLDRTVATALAGENPKNADGTSMLQQLDSKTEQTITKQLIDKETNLVNGNNITSSKSIVVLKDNSTYAFDYALTPKQLNLISCSTNQSVCFDCLYTLKFTITSDCDMQAVFVDSIANFTLGQYMQQCNGNGNATTGFIKHFEQILNIGTYTVTKTLTLSNDAQAYYSNKFLQTDTCKKLADFYAQELAVLQSTSNCAVTCTSCKAAIGNNLQGFIAKFAAEMGISDINTLTLQTVAQLTAAFNEAYANCDRICNNNDGLDLLRSTREMMLQDMIPPYGQYAKTDVNSTTKAYNIFKVWDGSNPQSNTAFNGIWYGINAILPDYKQPRKFNSGDATLIAPPFDKYYHDELNQPESFNPLAIASQQQFVDDFKTSWADQLLVHHPEFKKLQYSQNQLQPTYAFEALLEKDSTWAQAAAAHPSYGNYGFITNLIDADPFFNGVGAVYKSKMLNGRHIGFNQPPAGTNLNIDPVIRGVNGFAIPHTVTNPSPQLTCPNAPLYDDVVISMWQVALGTVFCRDKADGNQCVIQEYATDPNTKGGCTKNPAYYQPQNSFNEGCETDRNWAWKIFKIMYLAERRKLISVYLNQNAASFSATYPNNANPPYQERFINHANPSATLANLTNADAGNINTIINTASTNLTAGYQLSEQLAQQQYDTTCRGYAYLWLHQLKSCPDIAARLNSSNWTADSTWLVNNMVAICKKGSDASHYLGSSSVSPANTNTIVVDGQIVNNFEDVVRIYMNRTTPYPAITHPTAECYAWLINTPKPYDKQKPLAPTYVLTKPTDCECQRISDVRLEWQTSGFTGTFSAYMQYQHGTFISNEQLDVITAMCNNNYQCRMLEKPMDLPAALQCPSSHPNPAPKTCISCSDYQTLKNEVVALLGQPVPFVEPQNQVEVNYNYAFANYINNKTGFSKSWSEYVAFQNVCNANTPTISCTSLDSTLNAFYTTPEYLANPIGLSCIQAFVNYFNNKYNVIYTYSQWMALFAQCGSTPNVCKTRITCSSFTNLIEGFYTQNGVQVFRNNNCQNLFVSYINTQLSSNYTYAQLEAIYKYTCKGECPLNVCGFPNQFLLKRVVAAFKLANPQPWNLPNCKDAFATFFNNYFGLPVTPGAPVYNFDGIYENYYSPLINMGCVEDIGNICDPPYTCNDLSAIVEKFIATYDPVNQLPNCQQSFANFFNEIMGTNYTYAQIAAIFQSICGVPLSVCQIKTDCESIIVFAENNPIQAVSEELCHQQFLQLFNAHFGTNYTTWDELYALYKQCGYNIETVCKGCTLVADCAALNDFIKEFKTKYPDPATQLGSSCEKYFSALFNEQFGTTFTFAQISTYYLQQCNTVLDVCTSPCIKVTQFISEFTAKYTSLKLPAPAKQALFEFEYNKAFLSGAEASPSSTLLQANGGVLEVARINDVVADDPNLFNSTVNFPEIEKRIFGCGITSFSLVPTTSISIYDPQVLLALKQVYFIIHPNGLPKDCAPDFASWFNSVMKTQYEYKELFGIYNTVCGNNAGYICDAPVDQNTEARVFVDVAGSSVPTNLPPMLCGLNETTGGPVVFNDNPCQDLPKIAFHFAIEKYELYVDSLRDVFDAAYRAKCLAVQDLESFKVTSQQSEYHFTLYYYDQAGNLVKTVPPAGVNKLTGDDLITVKNYRANVLAGQSEAANQKVAPHTLITEYRYNTLGQIIAQRKPDAGVSKFYYDRLGRLTVTQNAKQTPGNKYSYTVYDALGRIKEVGQKTNANPVTQAITQSEAQLNGWLSATGAKDQITGTVYDDAYTPLQISTTANGGFYQKNLRNKISYMYGKKTESADLNYIWDAATFYSYDLHGNIDTLLQDYGSSASTLSANGMNKKADGTASGNRWKRIVYQYDLVSGKVNAVAYQPNQADAFYHRYFYDQQLNITSVETSTDKILWEKDARYEYYKYGPLARSLIGEQQVQGLDYAYTLHGWLKGVNSTSVADGSFDIGQDGKIGSPNKWVARDAYGFSINYFNGDYKPINNTVSNTFINNAFSHINADGNKTAHQLFNASIASILVNIPKVGSAQLYGYNYDQLNRLVSMDAFAGLNNSTNVFTAASTQNYKERISFDANGNIKTYLRNGDAGRVVMDDMTYSYKAGTNQLDKVVDVATDAAAGIYDRYADIKQGQANGNYQFDAIGNLISDTKEDVTIIWNNYGKIQSFTKGGVTTNYLYDADGNRICKAVAAKETWYVRDANGAILATYVKDATINTNQLTQTEVHLYGIDRLGIFNRRINVEVIAANPTNALSFTRGNKQYELVNYLDNVLLALSDKKIAVDITPVDGLIDYYEADVVNANDYYPFGMPMPSRKFSQPNTNYRFGFNGMEKDNDVYGEGNAYTTEYRMYDARLGRWFSIDPVEENSFVESPYVNNRNNPISCMDPDGDDPITGFLDALLAFGLSAGGDYVSSRIAGNSHSDAMDDIGWWSAGWEGVKTYASSVLKPPGVGMAQKLYKLANSKVGKVLVGTLNRIVTKATANYDAGLYNDEDGDFDLDKVLNKKEFKKLLIESFEEELQEQAMGAITKKLEIKTASATVGVTPSAPVSGGVTKPIHNNSNASKKKVTVYKMTGVNSSTGKRETTEFGKTTRKLDTRLAEKSKLKKYQKPDKNGVTYSDLKIKPIKTVNGGKKGSNLEKGKVAAYRRATGDKPPRQGRPSGKL